MSTSERLHSLSELLYDELREDCVERDIWCEECHHKQLCTYLRLFVQEYERKYDPVFTKIGELTKLIENEIVERKKQK